MTPSFPRPRLLAIRTITHSHHSPVPTTSRTRLAGSSRGQGTGRVPDSPYVLLQDVPRTSLRTDILRRLKATKAVSDDYALSNITLPPPSFPRRGWLSNPVHLKCDSPKAAQQLAASLTSRRPYPRISLDLRSVAQLTRQSAREWVQSYIDSLSAKNEQDGSATSTGSAAAKDANIVDQDEKNLRALGYSSSRKTVFRPPSSMTVDWALRPDLEGKRVVIAGLPGKMSGSSVDQLVKEYEVDTEEGIMRLPPSPNATTSIWCVTLRTTAEAYRLARELHCSAFEPDRYGVRFRLTAEVA